MFTVLMCCLEMSGNLCVIGCYSLLCLCVRCWIFITLWLKLWHNSEHLCVFWRLINIFCFCWLFTELCLKSSMSFIACFIVFFIVHKCVHFPFGFACLCVVWSLFLQLCIFMCCFWLSIELLQFTMTMLATVHGIVLQGAVFCFWYCSYISVRVSLPASSLHIILL